MTQQVNENQTNQQEEMELMDNVTTAIMEEETAGFFESNKTAIIGLGSGGAGFGLGFGIATWKARRERKAALEDIVLKIQLAMAGEEEDGSTDYVLGAKTHQKVKLENPNEVHYYIMNDMLKDTRMSKKERKEWREALVDLHRLSVITHDNAIKKTVVKEK